MCTGYRIWGLVLADKIQLVSLLITYEMKKETMKALAKMTGNSSVGEPPLPRVYLKSCFYASYFYQTITERQGQLLKNDKNLKKKRFLIERKYKICSLRLIFFSKSIQAEDSKLFPILFKTFFKGKNRFQGRLLVSRSISNIRSICKSEQYFAQFEQ